MRRQLIFENGYGDPFGIPDSDIESQIAGIASRHEILADSDIVIASKPVLADLEELRDDFFFFLEDPFLDFPVILLLGWGEERFVRIYMESMQNYELFL